MVGVDWAWVGVPVPGTLPTISVGIALDGGKEYDDRERRIRMKHLQINCNQLALSLELETY